MNTIELWHWRVTDPVSRRCYVTRYRMTQADARHFDPAAQRVEASLEQRVVRDRLQSISVLIAPGVPTLGELSSPRAARARSERETGC